MSFSKNVIFHEYAQDPQGNWTFPETGALYASIPRWTTPDDFLKWCTTLNAKFDTKKQWRVSCSTVSRTSSLLAICGDLTENFMRAEILRVIEIPDGLRWGASGDLLSNFGGARRPSGGAAAPRVLTSSQSRDLLSISGDTASTTTTNTSNSAPSAVTNSPTAVSPSGGGFQAINRASEVGAASAATAAEISAVSSAGAAHSSSSAASSPVVARATASSAAPSTATAATTASVASPKVVNIPPSRSPTASPVFDLDNIFETSPRPATTTVPTQPQASQAAESADAREQRLREQKQQERQRIHEGRQQLEREIQHTQMVYEQQQQTSSQLPQGQPRPAITTQPVTSQPVRIQAVMPQGAVPQAAVPQAAMSRGVAPQAIMPRSAAPHGAVPQAALSQGAVMNGMGNAGTPPMPQTQASVAYAAQMRNQNQNLRKVVVFYPLKDDMSGWGSAAQVSSEVPRSFRSMKEFYAFCQSRFPKEFRQTSRYRLSNLISPTRYFDPQQVLFPMTAEFFNSSTWLVFESEREGFVAVKNLNVAEAAAPGSASGAIRSPPNSRTDNPTRPIPAEVNNRLLEMENRLASQNLQVGVEVPDIMARLAAVEARVNAMERDQELMLEHGKRRRESEEPNSAVAKRARMDEHSTAISFECASGQVPRHISSMISGLKSLPEVTCTGESFGRFEIVNGKCLLLAGSRSRWEFGFDERDLVEEGQETAPLKEKELAGQAAQASPMSHQTSFVVQQTSPAVQQTSPVVQQTSPAVQQTSPAVQQTSPAVQQTSPVVHRASPVVHRASPVVHQVGPVSHEAARPDINNETNQKRQEVAVSQETGDTQNESSAAVTADTATDQEITADASEQDASHVDFGGSPESQSAADPASPQEIGVDPTHSSDPDSPNLAAPTPPREANSPSRQSPSPELNNIPRETPLAPKPVPNVQTSPSRSSSTLRAQISCLKQQRQPEKEAEREKARAASEREKLVQDKLKQHQPKTVQFQLEDSPRTDTRSMERDRERAEEEKQERLERLERAAESERVRHVEGEGRRRAAAKADAKIRADAEAAEKSRLTMEEEQRQEENRRAVAVLDHIDDELARERARASAITTVATVPPAARASSPPAPAPVPANSGASSPVAALSQHDRLRKEKVERIRAARELRRKSVGGAAAAAAPVPALGGSVSAVATTNSGIGKSSNAVPASTYTAGSSVTTVALSGTAKSKSPVEKSKDKMKAKSKSKDKVKDKVKDKDKDKIKIKKKKKPAPAPPPAPLRPGLFDRIAHVRAKQEPVSEKERNSRLNNIGNSSSSSLSDAIWIDISSSD